MRNKLKPCPFCGTIPEFIVTATGENRDQQMIYFTIKCGKCGTEAPTSRSDKYFVGVRLNSDGEIETLNDRRKDLVTLWNGRNTDERTG